MTRLYFNATWLPLKCTLVLVLFQLENLESMFKKINGENMIAQTFRYLRIYKTKLTHQNQFLTGTVDFGSCQ